MRVAEDSLGRSTTGSSAESTLDGSSALLHDGVGVVSLAAKELLPAGNKTALGVADEITLGKTTDGLAGGSTGNRQ